MQAYLALAGRRRARWTRYFLLALFSVMVMILVMSQVSLRGVRISPAFSRLECFRTFQKGVSNEASVSLGKWLAAFGGFLPPSNLDQYVLSKWYHYSDSAAKKLNNPDLKGDEEWLLEQIRNFFLVKPPAQDVPYCLEDPELKDPSMGQSEKIIKLLNNKTNGFFVECGGLDGETRSNTLYYERFLGWNGLLIEADPSNFQQMLPRRRKAWLSPTCLSLSTHPTMVSFEQKENQGRISDSAAGKRQYGHVDVQCLPFWSLLLALNQTTVDYFSLDVEGSELAVLKTIPFDKIDIKTLSVEFIHVEGGKQAIKDFMAAKGYVVDSEVTHPNWLANDFIFVKKDLLEAH